MARTYYVYIATNVARTAMYIGVTNDITRRMVEHRSGIGGGFTSHYRIGTLVYAETAERIEDAIAREKQLKGWTRARKNALVEAANPSWADLLEPDEAKDPSLRSG
jgi:putative endonuclease